MPPLSRKPLEAFPRISGYTITEQLYKGARTAVYRATTASQQPVVIKVMRQSHPDFSELVHFRNQYAITQNLSVPGVVCSLALEPWQNGCALVMEDFGGCSLQQYATDQSLSLIEVLGIALQMTDILHGLNQHHVVHKDIKPANILIEPASKQIQLIDFSIATLLPKESQEIQSPNVLEGTLAYLAPEQTGRMNRGIDYRTDFYGLGVTLYELLTGQMPFSATDPLELVHCHIARAPLPACAVNAEIPAVVSQIVLKLMAKNAEDRYQSAFGLKHDLTRCLQALKQAKESVGITEFELGQRDMSDRFLIPEKLYGREDEVAILLEAFERVAQGSAELMLVAGFSGIGKTAVVNEVHKPITRQSGYFIKGKFDQLNRNIPLSAFVQALRSLVGQLLAESDAAIAHWKTKILTAVGSNGQIIIEVIPELERIIGQQPTVPELSGSAAQSRFNLLFGKFIRIFTTQEHPLVLFLDDLQWADSASLSLLQSLMAASEMGYLLILGAYRDNEVFPAHPLMLTLGELSQTTRQITTLTLQPLSQASLNQLTADTLQCSFALASPLTELVHQKTQGNPFFATQFLKGLHDDAQIIFNREQGYWQCDLTAIQAFALTDNVVEFMTARLHKLPEATQDILKLAACLGNQFELSTLAAVCERADFEIAADLWKVLQEGLVLPLSKTYTFFQMADAPNEKPAKMPVVGYRFLHDRVQQAAHALISPNEEADFRLHIGRQLALSDGLMQNKQQLFTVVDNYNYGISKLSDADEQRQLMALNLKAGKIAIEATAYESAAFYLEKGRALVSLYAVADASLWYQIYLNSVEAEYLSSRWDSANQLLQQLSTKPLNDCEQLQVAAATIRIHIVQENFAAALTVGQSVLSAQGLSLCDPSQNEALKANLSTVDINSIRAMDDERSLLQMAVLLEMCALAVYFDPNLFTRIILTLIDLSQRLGYSGMSAFAFANYGMLLSEMGDYSLAYRAGCFALELLEHFDTKSLSTKVNLIHYSFISAIKKSVTESLAPLERGYREGLEVGDLLFSSFCVSNYCLLSLLCGENLTATLERIAPYVDWLKRSELDTSWTLAQVWYQLALNLSGQSEDAIAFNTGDFDEAVILPQLEASQSIMTLYEYHLSKSILCVHFSKWEIAREHLKQAEIHKPFGSGYKAFIWYFYDALVILSQTGTHSDANAALKAVEGHAAYLRKLALHAPMNFQHKHDLLMAEQFRIQGQKLEAINYYDSAIAGAKENKFTHEEALANELAARFYLDWGKETFAAIYMQAAYYCYSRWGAQAKANDLETRYPTLLQPILQQSLQSSAAFNPLETIIVSQISVHTSTQVSRASTTNVNAALDFATVLKASQALSGTIELEDLLRQLTQIILQNSGGDRCALILADSDGTWQLKALATPDNTDLLSESLAGHPKLPLKLIQYVKNTHQTVVIDSLETELPVIDAYLEQSNPQSLLCLPLLNQGKLLGILYLRNRTTRGVFTQARVHILGFLCTQAAISLENAHLYQQSQAYAQQLEQSQLQTVQAEKMASLGNLVAGVAHEINNPIGFLNGSLKNAQTYLQDLSEHLALYQQHHPQAAEPVRENAEDIDLDFLLEDFPKLLNSMTAANQRIKSISTSLRTFSRADTEHKVSANLHEGLDSTLLILKYRLKGNENRPEIEVIKDYGDLPIIDCFPGQLNQVFMNLLANAIDIFDEAAEQSSFTELKENPQIITVKTELCTQQNSRQKVATIRISDNGKGMTEAVKARIFDHLFTTKGVDKGTGLGLAIAQQIVVEKHGGSLTVSSELSQGTDFCIQLPF